MSCGRFDYKNGILIQNTENKAKEIRVLANPSVIDECTTQKSFGTVRHLWIDNAIYQHTWGYLPVTWGVKRQEIRLHLQHCIKPQVHATENQHQSSTRWANHIPPRSSFFHVGPCYSQRLDAFSPMPTIQQPSVLYKNWFLHSKNMKCEISDLFSYFGFWVWLFIDFNIMNWRKVEVFFLKAHNNNYNINKL